VTAYERLCYRRPRNHRQVDVREVVGLFYVAERRLNLAQPPKAGITHHPQLFVASATVECSIVADATQIQKHFFDPGLGRAEFMPTLRVENHLSSDAVTRRNRYVFPINTRILA
jgi:hypothetical protein